jgi:acyl-CoA synthetase (AMP-forming)/AMP-acid ligase II
MLMATPRTRYWKDEKQTRSAMRWHPGDDANVWMHTGDKGIMDKDGYLRSACHRHGASNISCTDLPLFSRWSDEGKYTPLTNLHLSDPSQ